MIAEKTQLFDSIMDNCLDIITVKDLNFTYKVCSRAFLKLFKFFHESYVIGKNIKEILPLESYEIVKRHLELVIHLREPQVYTFKIYSNNEELIFHELSTPIVENGEITGILSIASNITNEENLKIKLVEKIYELNSLLENKKQLEAQKELFLTTLTHDLKNPVQAQIMSLKMLKEGKLGTLNNSQKEILDILLESSNYMEDMLYSILKTYKYDNGLIELHKNLCDIGELTQKCINEVSSLANDRNIIISYTYKKTEINLDSEQIRRVIENLINNALNYAYKNSTINIEISSESSYISFSITNIGPQIPITIKNKIFDKYTTGNSLKGIGLGLYFSKKVIEAHKGTIKLNTDGDVCNFIFTLPITTDKQKACISWQ